MINENGGPAFPLDRDVVNVGMTLRDYFAAKAMQAYCSCDKWRIDTDPEATANIAYKMADAMLKAKQQ